MNGTGMDAEPHDHELEQRLEAYAQARLSLHPARSKLIRDEVMRAAHRRSAAPAAEAAEARPPTGIVVARAAHWRRTLPALLAAAVVLALLAGSALAARPGGPLYEARLVIEAAFLPSTGDARAAADIDRLDARLAEAVDAAASGDDDAVAAALAAYQGIVDEMASTSGTSDLRDAALEAVLARHLEVLSDLLSRVPEQARPAIEHAIERSDQAIDKIHEALGPNPNPGAEPTNVPPGQSGKPDRTPPGQPSDRPARSP